MVDFLANAPTNLGSADYISCVGFSDTARTRIDRCGITEAHKFLPLWEPRGGGTHLAQALQQARQCAATTPTHRIVYLMLTDGHIQDAKEAVKGCEAIRCESQVGVEKTMLFSIGLGASVNSGQLQELVVAANGNLIYEFNG